MRGPEKNTDLTRPIGIDHRYAFHIDIYAVMTTGRVFSQSQIISNLKRKKLIQMKILAMYLPQYHEIKENNEWWGKGYTEWSAVKKAKPYFASHKQPKIPLSGEYYDLGDPTAKALKWQAQLAKEYGIYGFVFYHYWFKAGKQLLERPMEFLLAHSEIDINYSICWANESWTRTWYGLEKEVLMQQEYGDLEEWTKHFEYLLQFFRDKRYIKINNRPTLHIYHSYEISDLPEILQCWNTLARENGFDGLYVISGNTGGGIDRRNHLFQAYYNFEPSYSLIYKTTKLERLLYGMSVKTRESHNRVFKHKVIERQIDGTAFVNRMLRDDPVKGAKIYPCVFPQWDNTPRRQYKGTIFLKMDPPAFSIQIHRILEKYKDSDFLYVNAWNEWGEGAYLEPDQDNQYAYLEELSEIAKQ